MRYKLLICILLASLVSGCGFHLQHETEIPPEFKTLVYVSHDPYGQLSRNLKELLADNKVNLLNINHANQYPTLQILGNNITKNTISIYQDGKAAEYQIVLSIDAQVIIAGRSIYPIKVSVFRSFFDNPAAALAKTAEQNMIEQEMYKEGAKQVIRKLKSVNLSKI